MRFLAALGLVLLSGCGGSTLHASRSSAPPDTSSIKVPYFQHIVVIVLENKGYTDIIGSREAPYINELAKTSGLAKRYYAIRHPSLPNYLALTGGSTFGVDSDCTDCYVTGSAGLVDNLEEAGLSWKAYLEGMPSPCFQDSSAGEYVKKHNPFLYYDAITGNHSRCSNVVPLSQLYTDLRAQQLPNFAWISPDLCHDMHECDIKQGDTFLSRLVPQILKELGPKGVLFLTFDEADNGSTEGCCQKASGGHVVTIVAGAMVRPGTVSDVLYDHYSLLRTIEDAWRLPLLGDSACSCTQAMSAFFNGR